MQRPLILFKTSFFLLLFKEKNLKLYLGMSLTDLSRLNFNLERYHLAKKREISFYLFIKKQKRDKKRKKICFFC